MATVSIALDAPLPPEAFRGREHPVQHICQRLLNPQRLPTSVVGGPRTGRTSLLRYLASPFADARLPGLDCRMYMDACSLSSTSRPSDFWARAFRGLRERAPTPALVAALDKRLADVQTRALDTYDLEDLFDAFGKAKTCAVILVDGWELVLKNRNYWGDFFHAVRSVSQRLPCGVAFVLATPRRLLDLWSDQMGSVYYNIFTTVTLGCMEEAEIRTYVRDALAAGALGPNPSAEDTVLAASDRHPYLVAVVTELVMDQLMTSGAIDPGAIGEALRDPAGKVVELIRNIRTELSATEKFWLDTLRAAPHSLSASQRGALEQLRDYGLLPPGTRL